MKFIINKEGFASVGAGNVTKPTTKKSLDLACVIHKSPNWMI
jgi:hypothetical protein